MWKTYYHSLISKEGFFLLTLLASWSCGRSVVSNHTERLKKQGVFCDLLDEINISPVLYDCDVNKLSDKTAFSDPDRIAWITVEDERYSGIGRYGGCTASVVETFSSNSQAPAYVLTNGHCLSPMAPYDDYWTDDTRYVSKSMSFSKTFNYSNNFSEFHTFATKKIAFATMNQTDVALIELDVTLNELKSLGIRSYPIAKQAPRVGLRVELVGIPMRYTQEDLIRKSVCTIKGQVPVKEDMYFFSKSYQHQCSMLPGSSGSPLIDHSGSEGYIVAINNTTVNDDTELQRPCSFNRPCEQKEDSEEYYTNVHINYAQPVVFISFCFNSEGYFDETLSNCQLADYKL